MDIDTEAHTAQNTIKITEDGKDKENWEIAQLTTTALVLTRYAEVLLAQANNSLVDNIKPTE